MPNWSHFSLQAANALAYFVRRKKESFIRLYVWSKVLTDLWQKRWQFIEVLIAKLFDLKYKTFLQL
jgi:hypothetical protein